jgi:hypothetical protein
MLAWGIGQRPRDKGFPRLPRQIIEIRFVTDANLNRLPYEVRPFSSRAGLLVGQSDRDLGIIRIGSAIVNEDG